MPATAVAAAADGALSRWAQLTQQNERVGAREARRRAEAEAAVRAPLPAPTDGALSRWAQLTQTQTGDGGTGARRRGAARATPVSPAADSVLSSFGALVGTGDDVYARVIAMLKHALVTPASPSAPMHATSVAAASGSPHDAKEAYKEAPERERERNGGIVHGNDDQRDQMRALLYAKTTTCASLARLTRTITHELRAVADDGESKRLWALSQHNGLVSGDKHTTPALVHAAHAIVGVEGNVYAVSVDAATHSVMVELRDKPPVQVRA